MKSLFEEIYPLETPFWGFQPITVVYFHKYRRLLDGTESKARVTSKSICRYDELQEVCWKLLILRFNTLGACYARLFSDDAHEE